MSVTIFCGFLTHRSGKYTGPRFPGLIIHIHGMELLGSPQAQAPPTLLTMSGLLMHTMFGIGPLSAVSLFTMPLSPNNSKAASKSSSSFSVN